MRCANPNCTSTMLYLRGGVLRLLELECAPANRLHGHADGFPVCRPTARYFWLCGDCAKVLVMRRWTPQGLILESLPSTTDAERKIYTVAAVPAVEPSSVMHFRLPAPRSA